MCMINFFISVTSHALDPPPSVTNCHTFSDPLPLERYVLYGRPHRIFNHRNSEQYVSRCKQSWPSLACGHTCTVHPTSVRINPLIDRVTPRRLLHSKSRMISTLTWTTSRAVCCCLLTSQRNSICWTSTHSCQDFTWTSASQALHQHGSVPT